MIVVRISHASQTKITDLKERRERERERAEDRDIRRLSSVVSKLKRCSTPGLLDVNHSVI